MCSDCHDYNNKGVKHAKEDRVYQVLQSNGIVLESYDRMIQDTDTRCSKRRPDFVIDKGTYKIIVEVDENQHMSYACECEQTRMRQIYFDLGGQDLVFIRYNPDSYKDQYGKKKLTRDITRERALLDLLKCFDNVDSIEEQVRIYYMYYDGYSGTPERFSIDPYLTTYKTT
jgi:hypothetical protein